MATEHDARTNQVGAPSTAGGPSDAPATSGGGLPVVQSHPAPGGGRVMTLRLPLVSATVTRRPHPDRPVATTDRPVLRPPAGAAPAVAGVSLPRLAFYAGALVLGALEVVEWPVTLLVVAGTYLAEHVRGPAPADPAAAPAGSAARAEDVPDRAVLGTGTGTGAGSGTGAGAAGELVPPAVPVAHPGGT